MKRKKIIVLLAVIVFLVQAACSVGGTTATTQAPPPVENIGDQIATGIALTLTAQQVVEAPANTPAPLEVLPTITPELPTFTAVPSVQGTINYGANCRTGPGANFPNVLVYEQGTLVNVIGTNKGTDKSTWWLVSSSGQIDCWLIDAAVAISGDKSSVALVISPPTPSPVPPASLWAGNWTIWVNYSTGNAPSSEEIFSINWIMTGYDTITGSYGSGDCIYYDTLTVDPDGMRANGRESSSNCGNYDVTLYMNTNHTQFSGHWNFVGASSSDGYYCGARAGFGKPNPCKR